MTQPKISAGAQLNAAKLAISTTMDDAEIQVLLGARGYPAAKLQEGRSLHEAAVDAAEVQKYAAGSQQLALRLLVVVEHGARDAYQTLARVLKAVQTSDQAGFASLHITDPMPDDAAPFVVAASVLFEEVRGIPALVNFGYDEVRMEDEREKIAAFYVASQRHEAACAANERATGQLEAALQSLNEWTEQYVRVARAALRGRKQLLEKLGLSAGTSQPHTATQSKSGQTLPTSAPSGTRAAAMRTGKKQAS